MTELERWMNDHPPLADALTAGGAEAFPLGGKVPEAPPEGG